MMMNNCQKKTSLTLSQGADLIKKGQIVAFPTETVYGVGASLFDARAVASVYQLKKRSLSKRLGAYLANVEDVKKVAVEIPELFYELARRFLPGPLTLILKKHPDVPSIVTGGGPTIAVRIPDHTTIIKLISAVGEPIAGTSANLSGHPSPKTPSDVWHQFGQEFPLITEGKKPLGVESTIVSLCTKKPTLLRCGALPKEQISFFL